MSEYGENLGQYRDMLLRNPTPELVADITAMRAVQIGRSVAEGDSCYDAEMIMRNPTVFCDRLTPEQFTHLPEEVQQDLVTVATFARKQLVVSTPEDEERHLHETDSQYQYRIKVWQPMHGLQRLVDMGLDKVGGYTGEQAVLIGGLINQAGRGFAGGLKYAATQGWQNVTKEVRYFAGNTRAALPLPFEVTQEPVEEDKESGGSHAMRMAARAAMEGSGAAAVHAKWQPQPKSPEQFQVTAPTLRDNPELVTDEQRLAVIAEAYRTAVNHMHQADRGEAESVVGAKTYGLAIMSEIFQLTAEDIIRDGGALSDLTEYLTDMIRVTRKTDMRNPDFDFEVERIGDSDINSIIAIRNTWDLPNSEFGQPNMYQRVDWVASDPGNN